MLITLFYNLSIIKYINKKELINEEK